MRSLNLFQGTAKFQNVLLKELLNILQKNRSLDSCMLFVASTLPTTNCQLQTDDLSSRKLLTDNSENIGTEKMLATDFSSLNLNSGF